MASSFELVQRIANPPTNSLASVKGPSVTLIFPSERRTRAPRALGKQPSVATSQPALKPSSMSLPILDISSCEGGVFLSTDLYKLRNFMSFILLNWRCDLSLILLVGLALLLKIFGAENLPNFGYAFPLRPMYAVQFHEFLVAFDGFFLGFEIKDCETSDDFLSLGERTIGGGELAIADTNVGAGGDGSKAAGDHHGVVSLGFFGEFVDGIHERLRRRSGQFFMLFDQHHKSHRFISF